MTTAERVQAYVADCSHRFTVVDEENDYEGQPEVIDECEYYPFDQNCMPDPAGCWDTGQECIRACSKPCNTCQAACASGCDGCKAACADGSVECIRKCAEARLECRDACMTAAEQCESVDCPKQEEVCNKAFSRERKQKCPKCKEIGECFSQDHGDEDLFTACGREFPRARKECLDWCWDYEDEDDDEL
jgi:hypothetical protein